MYVHDSIHGWRGKKNKHEGCLSMGRKNQYFAFCKCKQCQITVLKGGWSHLLPTNHSEDILLSALFHAKHKRLISYLENNIIFRISAKTQMLINRVQKRSKSSENSICSGRPTRVMWSRRFWCFLKIKFLWDRTQNSGRIPVGGGRHAVLNLTSDLSTP